MKDGLKVAKDQVKWKRKSQMKRTKHKSDKAIDIRFRYIDRTILLVE